MSFGGFSWKRAFGVTKAKRKIAKGNWNPDNKGRSEAEGAKSVVEILVWEIKSAPGTHNTGGG